MNRQSNSIFLLLLLFFLCGNTLAQSDPQPSQFYASSIYLNPAMSGLEHNFAVGGIYRIQNVGIVPYQIGLINAIIPYHDKGETNYHKGGFGVNVWNARSGDGTSNHLGASLNAAYNLHIAATTAQNLTFGVQIGFIQRQYSNVSNYQFGSQYNEAVGYDASIPSDALFSGTNTLTKIVPDITAGILYYYNAGRDVYAPGLSAYIGVVGAHLNQPNAAFVGGQTSVIPILFRLHGGIEVHVAKRVNMSPNFLFTTQSQFSFAMAGLNFTYLFPDHDEFLKPTRFLFGGAYRFDDAAVGLVGFGSKYYNLGFSYDFGVGSLTQSFGKIVSAYEVSLKTSIHIGSKTKKSSKFHTPLM
ncbi:MAG: PorP/SprF family type IX secretion system membrane protein [Cytophagales bacterium]